jgi:hypothetical protein
MLDPVLTEFESLSVAPKSKGTSYGKRCSRLTQKSPALLTGRSKVRCTDGGGGGRPTASTRPSPFFLICQNYMFAMSVTRTTQDSLPSVVSQAGSSPARSPTKGFRYSVSSWHPPNLLDASWASTPGWAPLRFSVFPFGFMVRACRRAVWSRADPAA